jgi:AmmeMemoRadiSam system protein B
MSHFVSEKVAKQKDQKAIERILAIDPEGLYETVVRERISMCGYLPVTAMLAAVRELGAQSARLIKYATSGDITGDYESVVGYAGVVVR